MGVALICGDVLIPTETVEACALRREEWCLTPNSSESETVCFLSLISSSDLKSGLPKKSKMQVLSQSLNSLSKK